MTNLQIHSTLRTQKLPKINFRKIKDEILGADYELSLLLCSDKLAKKLNKQYRRKSYVPNTLSFAYSKKSGEIILNPKRAEKEASGFGHSFKEHLIFLFIHSLLHLKGCEHGEKMESLEKKYLGKFSKY